MSEVCHVYRIGSAVELLAGLSGTIVEVSVSTHGVRYLVAWWDGRTRNTAWLEESEILGQAVSDVNAKVTIGFK